MLSVKSFSLPILGHHCRIPAVTAGGEREPIATISEKTQSIQALGKDALHIGVAFLQGISVPTMLYWLETGVFQACPGQKVGDDWMADGGTRRCALNQAWGFTRLSSLQVFPGHMDKSGSL